MGYFLASLNSLFSIPNSCYEPLDNFQVIVYHLITFKKKITPAVNVTYKSRIIQISS
jgi:hypothetical protein